MILTAEIADSDLDVDASILAQEYQYSKCNVFGLISMAVERWLLFYFRRMSTSASNSIR